MGKNYLVLDIGGTFVKYAIMDGEANFVDQGKVPAATTSEDEMLASLADLRAQVGDDYEGVAISMPGRIGTREGIAYTGGAFQWIRDYPAAERYGAVFGKATTIANDGKCAALAESWKGALSDVDSGAVIVLGTGIGGGIVLNREVWMGNSGGAGELSFFPTSFEGIRGGISFSSLGALWVGRVAASAISGQFAHAKGLEKADGIMLFDAYDAGDADAKAVLDEFGYQMAAGIMSLQSVLDLPRYAIGGGISARPETTRIVSEAVGALFDASIDILPFGRPEIVTCKFGNEANLIGALAFHLRAAR